MILYMTQGSTSKELDSCTIIVNWLNVLSYLKGFALTGSLVRMLISVMLDMRGFLMLLIMLLFAFSLSLSVLIPHEEGFDDFRVSPITTFNMMLGNVEAYWFDDPHERHNTSTYYVELHSSGTRATAFSVLADFFFFFFMLLIVIVMLNLLVAILGNTYAKIAEHEHVQMEYERARCIYEIERHFLPNFLKTNKKFFPRFLHVIEPTVAKKGIDDTSEIRIRREFREQVDLIRGEIVAVQEHIDHRVARVLLLLEPGIRIKRNDHPHPFRAVHFHLWSRTFTGGKWRCSACMQDFAAGSQSVQNAHELCFVCEDHYPQAKSNWRPPARCNLALCSVCVRNEVVLPERLIEFNDESGDEMQLLSSDDGHSNILSNRNHNNSELDGDTDDSETEADDDEK